MAARQNPVHPPAPVLRRENQAEPVPPESFGLVTDLDATLVQQILDVP